VQQKQSITASAYVGYLSSARSAITLGLIDTYAPQFPKPKTKGLQIWPSPRAAEGPATLLSEFFRWGRGWGKVCVVVWLRVTCQSVCFWRHIDIPVYKSEKGLLVDFSTVHNSVVCA